MRVTRAFTRSLVVLVTTMTFLMLAAVGVAETAYGQTSYRRACDPPLDSLGARGDHCLEADTTRLILAGIHRHGSPVEYFRDQPECGHLWDLRSLGGAAHDPLLRIPVLAGG